MQRTEHWLSSRTRLQGVLADLTVGGRELGMPGPELSRWKTAAAGLGEPFLVMLLGKQGSGKTTLAGALVGAALDDADSASERIGGALAVWKYGFDPADVADGDIIECYRAAPNLRGCEFAELDDVAGERGTELAEKAFAMADALLLVFSAADPWDKEGWEFLRGIHRRRERPAAAVITNVERRTDEELDAIAEYLAQTARAALTEDVPVFRVSSSDALGAYGGQLDPEPLLASSGIRELGVWLAESAMARSAVRSKIDRARLELQSAAGQISVRLQEVASDTAAESECIAWIDGELARERSEAIEESSRLMGPAQDVYQNHVDDNRTRLSRSLGLVGLPGSFLLGSGWGGDAQERSADEVAGRAADAVRQAVAGAGARMTAFSRRLGESVTGVFGDTASGLLPVAKAAETLGANAEALGRRAAARVGDAAGDSESAAGLRAMLSARRLMLWVFVIIVAASAVGVWWLWDRGEGILAMLVGGSCMVVVLWAAVYLRERKQAILGRYDREVGAAREQIGIDLAKICDPEIGAAFDVFDQGLAPLREHSANQAQRCEQLRQSLAAPLEFAARTKGNSEL